MGGELIELRLEQHGIHPKFWPEFKALILEGTAPGDELQIRLLNVVNYQAALAAIRQEHQKP
jgi:hypothetical protein